MPFEISGSTPCQKYKRKIQERHFGSPKKQIKRKTKPFDIVLKNKVES